MCVCVVVCVWVCGWGGVWVCVGGESVGVKERGEGWGGDGGLGVVGFNPIASVRQEGRREGEAGGACGATAVHAHLALVLDEVGARRTRIDL